MEMLEIENFNVMILNDQKNILLHILIALKSRREDL
jgi:hypothetical protein